MNKIAERLAYALVWTLSLPLRLLVKWVGDDPLPDPAERAARREHYRQIYSKMPKKDDGKA